MAESQKIETTLLRVNRAVTTGDLSALASLAVDIEDDLAAFAGSADAASAQRVRQLATRNAACLDAALRGLRAARRRMADIAAAQAGVQTYDVRGATRRLGGTGTTLTQRL